MTDNEILARWQGWLPNNSACTEWCDMKGYVGDLPDYPNDAAACDSLLDTLVDKGYAFRLVASRFLDQGTCIGYVLSVLTDNEDGMNPILDKIGNTRREAVVAACLKLIGKEMDV